MKKKEEASKAFMKVLEINPKNADSCNYIGYMWADQNINLDKALEYINKALELEPKNGAFLDSLGWVYFRLGRIDEAMKYIEEAAAQFKEKGWEDAVICEHLGDIYSKKYQTNKAKDMYEKSIKLDPRNEDVKKKLKALENTQQ